MLFIRFAVLSMASKKEFQSFKSLIAGIEINAQLIDQNEKNTVVLLTATNTEDFELSVSSKNEIIIPEKTRGLCEEVIEAMSNILSVFNSTEKGITSPIPCAAIQFNSEEEKLLLNKTKGMKSISKGFHHPEVSIPLTSEYVEKLIDRLDGVAILSESLTSSEVGRFKEYVRFFELALARSFVESKNLIYNLLKNLPYRYTRDEIKNWIKERHPSSHGDLKKSDRLSFVSDVRDYLPRMKQAALDILFNKKNWHTPDNQRRKIWFPQSYSTTPNGELVTERGKAMSLYFRNYDNFGKYPQHMGVRVNEKVNWYWKFNAKKSQTPLPGDK